MSTIVLDQIRAIHLECDCTVQYDTLNKATHIRTVYEILLVGHSIFFTHFKCGTHFNCGGRVQNKHSHCWKKVKNILDHPTFCSSSFFSRPAYALKLPLAISNCRCRGKAGYTCEPSIKPNTCRALWEGSLMHELNHRLLFI